MVFLLRVRINRGEKEDTRGKREEKTGEERWFRPAVLNCMNSM